MLLVGTLLFESRCDVGELLFHRSKLPRSTRHSCPRVLHLLASQDFHLALQHVPFTGQPQQVPFEFLIPQPRQRVSRFHVRTRLPRRESAGREV